MADRIFIVGNDNKVDANCSGIVYLNGSGEVFTTEDNNKTFLFGKGMYVDEEGVSAPVKSKSKVYYTDFETVKEIKIYLVDCTGGDVTATIEATGTEFVFVKIDSSGNSLVLSPSGADINGSATFDITAQYQKETVVWDEESDQFYV